MSEYFKVNYLTDSKTGKTKVWEVQTLDSMIILGYIKWLGRWRKYVFHPEPNTLYDNKCMIELARICEEKTREQLKR